MSSNVLQPNPPHKITLSLSLSLIKKLCCLEYPSATPQKNPHLHHCLSKEHYFSPSYVGFFGFLCLGQSFTEKTGKARTFSPLPFSLSISFSFLFVFLVSFFLSLFISLLPSLSLFLSFFLASCSLSLFLSYPYLSLSFSLPISLCLSPSLFFLSLIVETWLLG